MTRERHVRLREGVGVRFPRATRQIIGALQSLDSGVAAKDVARELGVNVQTLYRWRKKFGGMDVNEARRLKQLEDENRRLKRLVADLTLDTLDAPGRQFSKMVTPGARRASARYLQDKYGVSERRACRATSFHRSVVRYRTVRPDDELPRSQLHEFAGRFPRYGYLQLNDRLLRQGEPPASFRPRSAPLGRRLFPLL